MRIVTTGISRYQPVNQPTITLRPGIHPPCYDVWLADGLYAGTIRQTRALRWNASELDEIYATPQAAAEAISHILNTPTG